MKRTVLVVLLCLLLFVTIASWLKSSMKQQRLAQWKQSTTLPDGEPINLALTVDTTKNHPMHVKISLEDSQKQQQQFKVQEVSVKAPPPPPFKAAMVVLIRERELDDMVKTMEIFEKRFNHKYNYPYIFLNEVDFSDHFKETIQRHTKAEIRFGKIPIEHWSYPPWIDQKKAADTREKMKNIIYGSSESYRFMCHYQSGYFFQHPLFDGLDYYWRVEPGTKLCCDVPYDPFEFVFKNKIKYGFTISIGEYRDTIPTLWKTTMDYVQKRRQKQPSYNPELLKFFKEDGKDDYNGCHFWSNFEIGSVAFMRSPEYTEYFNHLDNAGGFFYERWGDAPVHSLAAGLFLKKSEVHYFDDIGYFHNPLYNCPDEPLRTERKCDCKREESSDVLHKGWSCVPKWKLYTPKSWF